MSSEGEGVKVAVRVRPFNQRERDRGSVCIIEMDGTQTKITNPDPQPGEDPKTFAFDYSYWSHDGFHDDDGVLVADNDKYATQRRVFEDLGQGVLDNAFEGYNCSLFAYGQTGSGKSYSMVGYGKNRGIVPISCDELFQAIERASGDVKYEITFSMLEIYNEQVRDLLTKDNPKGGLAVRQNPKLGLFYVENQKKVAVGSYKEIERRMDEGTANRTVASTQMNATSSRAHTVVTITFDQIMKKDGNETKKSSSINLVDLAGSERADSTGATGDRLKEGANINKSLSALGNVISALADLSMGKKKVLVPYRGSILTKLLMNALGGNSKTIMIAALSPADINYDETLSTLRYADRAKKIKNKAVVNENPMDKLIRELREENERLKASLTGGVVLTQEKGMSQEDVDKMRKQMEDEIRAQLLANQNDLAGMDWDEKLKEARQEEKTSMKETKLKEKQKNVPHLVNLNEDPMLSGVIVHGLSKDKVTLIGRKDADPKPNIILTGLSIQKEHASLSLSDGEVVIKPGSQGAKTKVNGTPLTGERKLEHNDRILFGSNHLYIFQNPLKPTSPEGTPETIDWDFAQKELAENSGFSTLQSGLTKDQQKAQEQVLELLPMIGEVNAVSEELNKYRHFELILISGATQDDKDKGTRVMVRVTNLLNKNVWMWERGQFINRRYMIQELYQQFVDGDDSYLTIEKEKDPFYDPPQDYLIGSSNAFLQSLSYALDFDDKLTITDHKGQEEGGLYVVVSPCNAKGKPLPEEENFVEDPSELIGQAYHVKVTVKSADIDNSRFTNGLYVQYKFLNESELTTTPVIKGTLRPDFNHQRIISIPSMSQEHLDFFDNSSISFKVYGVQIDSAPDASVKKLTTKELKEMDTQILVAKKPLARRSTAMSIHDTQQRAELHTLQGKYNRLERKERRIQEICKEWSAKPKKEQDFDGLMRAVNAVAFSSGNKLRNKVRLVTQVLQAQKYVQEKQRPSIDGDSYSIYSFEMPPDSRIIAEPTEGPIKEEDEHDTPKSSANGKKMKTTATTNGTSKPKSAPSGQKQADAGADNGKSSKVCVLM
uniref:kinesin-like protein KIF28P isoform X1 n=1 Tax=Styela clava TaxID=7725 RepID=UPI00193A79B2|nr:kinesin-like protein KIF28P isoform X1 [Styela clava]